MLMSLFIYSYAEAIDLSCDKSRPLQNFYGLLDNLACQPLEVGTSKIVHLEANESPTTVRHKYILERTTSHTYKVKLNLVLQENTMRAKQETALCQKMRNKINGCLKEINQHLSGPDNYRIKIEIFEPNEENKKKYAEIAHYITVDSDPIERENSGFYSLHTDCATIAHELLHLMGLVDEYKEMANIPSYAQDCRSLGPQDSIMYIHYFATNKDFTTKNTRYWTKCTCESGNHCKKIDSATQSQLKTCPPGYVSEQVINFSEVVSSPGNFTPKGGMSMLGMNLSEDEEKFFFLGQAQKSGRIPGSYLYPAHFRAITSPLCFEQNMTYYLCARDAYHWPFKWVESCHERPQICNEPLEWLK
jgi:hypothetical protein